jgi:hypothetical protein
MIKLGNKKEYLNIKNKFGKLILIIYICFLNQKLCNMSDNVIQMNTSKIEEAQTVNTYDPNKKYTWAAEDSFILSGGEFGVILNTLRAILGTPEAAKILLANQANNIIEGSLARAVEAGIVKEAPEAE